ncbi:hypothetical protein [Nocardia brasiliensis]|uniref:hypothetical protein n=1 Tax=Nocardia brasiliensis TaxID=37326 RepID=UPI003D8A898C
MVIVRRGNEEIRGLIIEFGELARRSRVEGVRRSAQLASRLDAEELVEVLLAARETAFDALGPQYLFGGPGPWYRWQVENVLVQLEHEDWGVQLSLLPKEDTERSESEACEWGDRDQMVAEIGLWVAEFDNGGVWDGYSPGGKLAPDWGAFEEWAAETLHSLESDFTILDMGLSILVTSMQNDVRSIRLRVEPGRITAVASLPHDMDGQVLGSLGWCAGEDGAWCAVRSTPSWQDVQELAHLVGATLRAYGLELGRVRYSTECRYSSRVHLLGLGVGRL